MGIAKVKEEIKSWQNFISKSEHKSDCCEHRRELILRGSEEEMNDRVRPG